MLCYCGGVLSTGRRKVQGALCGYVAFSWHVYRGYRGRTPGFRTHKSSFVPYDSYTYCTRRNLFSLAPSSAQYILIPGGFASCRGEYVRKGMRQTLIQVRVMWENALHHTPEPIIFLSSVSLLQKYFSLFFSEAGGGWGIPTRASPYCC